MADIYWPSELPTFEASSFSSTFASTIIRTPMDSGYDKTRKRYTKSRQIFSGSIRLSSDQLDTFEDFVTDDLNYGINTFIYTDPINLTDSINVRFKANSGEALYTIVPVQGDVQWDVSFVLEKMDLGF